MHSPQARATAVATITALSLALSLSATAAAGSPWETTQIIGQGPAGPLVAGATASLQQTSNGLSVKVSMPTPQPGSYTYPVGPTASGVAGHPEAFSLWVFVFFNPEACEPCSIAKGVDIGNPDKPHVIAGAFGPTGHIVGGPHLTLSGHLSPMSVPVGGNSVGEALALGLDLADAQIHVAVAPHGALAPELLPEQISTPAGNTGLWWLAKFN